jgi:hypothetical protein
MTTALTGTQMKNTYGDVVQCGNSGSGITAVLQQMRDGLGNVTSFLLSSIAAGLVGLLTKYNNIATAGWGVPAIYGYGRATAQAAANASVATYTVGAADGSFIVSANVNIVTVTACSFTVTVTYTDETNTVRTATFTFTLLATQLTTITNVTGTGAYEGLPMHIRAKAGTAITIASAAGGTYTTVSYNIEGMIAQIA